MSDAPSFMPDHDFVELVWENGPIVMQGQSNRQKKSSNPTPFPSDHLRVQEKDGRDPTTQKFGLLETMHSTNELSPAVPCANIGLNTQDDDMALWMNYPIEDPLCSEFFSELAVINPNPRPTERNNGVAKDFNVENGNTSKALREGSEPSKFKTNHLSQSSIVNTTRPKLVDSSARHGQSQKQDLVSSPKPLYSSSGFGLMNFSHFSRPAPLARVNNESLDRLKAKEKVPSTSVSTNQTESTLIQCSETMHKVEMRSVAKAKWDVKGNFHDDASRNNHHNNSVAANKTPCDHKITNQISSFAASVAVGNNDTEKGPEPIIASSSVCSANSTGAASNDPKRREKRKNWEGEESGYHSEDLDESTGFKKTTAVRGGTNTKRTRAAEVHNLSERRRRDRINEKMRALQELIPNCNKVDKASMLDEAIEYLKTLQLQVQMMSMGSGLCIPPMMLSPGMQHMRTPPMAHFSPMNVGMRMGMGLGYGMGMLDMNRIPIPSMHTSQFPCPPIPGSTGLQLFGIPGHMHGHGQGLPMPLPRATLFNPLSNLTPEGNSMNEVSGTIATPSPASHVGPSSRCMNLEAKQNVSNSES